MLLKVTIVDKFDQLTIVDKFDQVIKFDQVLIDVEMLLPLKRSVPRGDTDSHPVALTFESVKTDVEMLDCSDCC